MERRPRQFSLASMFFVLTGACMGLALLRLFVSDPWLLYPLYLGGVSLLLLWWSVTNSH